MRASNTIPIELPLTLRVTEVAKQLGIARGKAYELVAKGEIPSIRIGRSVRVPTADLIKWIEAKMAAS